MLSGQEKLRRLRLLHSALPAIDPGSPQAPWQRAIEGLLRLEIYERAYAMSDQHVVEQVDVIDPG